MTEGVFSSLYAGILNPEYRVTASSLSSVVNGVATLLMLIVIDPQLSMMTDENLSEHRLRARVLYPVVARVIGTGRAQVLFLPAAALTALVASWF